MAADGEALLRSARRPLVLGIGGGGDVVGALATAEHARRYDGAQPVVGGVTWERRPIDPVPGPRRPEEIEGAEPLCEGALLAGAQTRVRGRDVYFAESRMAQYLGAPTLLVALDRGPAAIAASIGAAADALGIDLMVFVDVGGDVLAQGSEPGLRSPLCDAMLLAAGRRLAAEGRAVLLGIFGVGCDAELTGEEVLAQLAAVAAAGGWCATRGLTEPVATVLEEAVAFVPTEASAQAVAAFRGGHGLQTIRGGARSLLLGPAAALTFYLDLEIAYRASGRLARAVDGATSLEEASAALNALGVRTELDLELAAAAGP